MTGPEPEALEPFGLKQQQLARSAVSPLLWSAGKQGLEPCGITVVDAQGDDITQEADVLNTTVLFVRQSGRDYISFGSSMTVSSP